MAQTVKQKIRWGTLFLFILLMLLGGVSIFHIVRLKNDSQIILQDNYESLDYCHAMQRALDSVAANREVYLGKFDSLLRLQESNVTERGEKAATEGIRSYFDQYRQSDHSGDLARRIKADIHAVLALNMAAIELKNRKANITASQALTYITLIASVTFLIGLTFSFNFPSIVIGPIGALTEGIKAVSAKNYLHRIHLDRKDEFGQMAGVFNEMAGRLEYFENSNLNKIIFEKTRAEAVINSLKDASIGIDKSNTILFANNQALQLLNMQASQLITLPVQEVAQKNDLFRFLMEEKGGMPFKIVVDNRENYFVKEIIEIGQDGANGKVIVLKNITSFKEIDVAKTNFIATISHELKTPLASSDFSIKLLEDERVGKLSAEQRELVHNLKQDNQRMLKILSELLNMSQVEAGKIQIEMTRVSPYDIADRAIQAVTTTAKEKNISISQDFEENLGNVYADAEKTGWVLTNFLTNAIRHAGSNSAITVAIRATGEQIEFSVKDEGRGIPPEYLPRVFDRFFKVPGSTGNGTGLGLSISKEFIEAQQGTIWARSEMGMGSVFGCNLPRVND